ncbi:MAG: DUF5103 domain-containing protein [Prevotellaceae bacterium]|jgi:hypothetical protein|nr:DUF5103 domain-containing protein [Prevotellaceae bacterium]
MKWGKYLILFILLLFFTNISAQNSAGVYKQIGFRDYCYDSNIKTARIFKTGNEISDPIITLRSNETLTLMFDDLANESRRFFYSIIHCDADWNDDRLMMTDYMSGFPETQINEFNYSSNTRTSYNNISLTIPNKDVRLKISGNYIIKIFDAETRELLLQKGFSFVEPLTRITANMRNSPLNNQRCMQQIDFSVSHPTLQVNDAFMELKVRIEQNSARIPGMDNPLPAFTQPGLTEYTRSDKNLFPGNNEFRAFDIRNNSFTGMGVNSIRVEQGTYRILLNEDKIRTTRYMANKDNNGKYVIGANLTNYPNIEADYAEVFFTLLTIMPFVDGRVFLMGEFTDWNIDSRYELIYDPELSQYETTQSLKQGYYNYRYVILKNDGEIVSEPIDGCFADTENNYNIYIYYRSYADRYDRLVGFDRINTYSTIR